MTRLSTAIVAGIALLLLGHSPAFAYDWLYHSAPLLRADNRSETEYSVADRPRPLMLFMALVHLPSETPTDRIMILSGPAGSGAPFSSRTIRLRFDHGAWETREVPTNPADLGNIPHLMHYLPDDGLIDRMRNAEHLTIEVSFRDYGVRQFEFDVAGLQWARATGQ